MKKQLIHSRVTQLQLSSTSVAVAHRRAEVLGLSLSQYIQSLITQDSKHEKDPWRQPLPDAVVDTYEQEYQQFLIEEKKGTRKAYSDPKQYVHDMTA
jgi:hypothetical protein